MNSSSHSLPKRTVARARYGAVAVEAAVVMPILLTFMFGIWEVGRLVQVNQILYNAAREGARLAAGGSVNGTPVTATQVQQAVTNYLQTAGFPAAAYSGAQVNLVCLATPTWTNPSDAIPLDQFRVTVTIPSGTAFDSLRWSFVTQLTPVRQLTATVSWQSLNNSEINVDTQLPF